MTPLELKRMIIACMREQISLKATLSAVDELSAALLQQTPVSGSLPQSTDTYMLLAGGRTLITGTFDECKDYADKLVKPVGTKLNIVNVVWRQ